jgi:CBS domain-containing protein
MRCEEIMTRNPKCCAATDTAARAAKLMRIEDVGSVPVCGGGDSRRLVGIITDRDLALQVVAEGRDPNSTQVSSIMTREPFTCRLDENVEMAFDRMESNQVRRIPVVDRDGLLVGIISQADIALRCQNPEKTAEVVLEISQPAGMHA